MNKSLEDLLEKILSYNSEEYDEVLRAYKYAEKLHSGQKRQSGEDYISHPLNVAYILAEMHADKNTICAALLHDTLEDTSITKEEIERDFGVEIAKLVDGVTKLSKMNFSTKEDQNSANTRKIITSITEDVRIIIIKLADRLHNMRTLQYKTKFKQKENAVETMEIFVPLAYYIGAYRLKSELEDLSLQYLRPEEYLEISNEKQKIEEESKDILEGMLQKIKSILENENIPNEIKLRTKNIYGIYQKRKQEKKLSNIHDLLSLKVMVDEVDNCYRTLGYIHRLYKPINHKFKDYICNPKTNMYSSLHTTVFSNGKLVQTQIRTFDMDKIASFGLTAYWDINKGQARYTMQEDLRSKYQFFKSLNEINETFSDNNEFVKQVKKELFSRNIYVYTPTGDVIELPSNSTPIDLAYKLNETLANTMIGAKVNDEYVDVGYKLQNKDRVMLLTSDMPLESREEWVGKASTSLAQKKLRIEWEKNN